jgi:hypothetical protein
MLDIAGVFIDHRSHDEIAPTSGKSKRNILTLLDTDVRILAAFEAARDAWKVRRSLWTLTIQSCQCASWSLGFVTCRWTPPS